MKNIYRYTVYVGNIAVMKTNDRAKAYDTKEWFNMKRPKAPVRIHSNLSTT